VIFSRLVVTYYTIDIYDVLVIQDPDGELLSIKIEEYEPEQPETPQYIQDDEIIH
tara:strand:+ start:6612 stop:6776 length:165 start_codon:yes stop_codon:yes gene_type:complete